MSKEHLEIVFDEGNLNSYKINGNPGRLSSFKKVSQNLPTKKHSDAFVLLSLAASRQGELVSVADQIAAVSATIPEEEKKRSKSGSHVSTRVGVARDLLVYQLRHEGRPVISFKRGSHGTAIGIVDFTVNVSKDAIKK